MNNNEANRLAKRLNDWFLNMYTSTQRPSTSAASTEPPPPASTSTLTARNEEERDEDSDDEEQSAETVPVVNSEDDQEARRKARLNFRQANLFSLTSSIIGSRIRSKQAQKSESSIVKEKPTPKVKMVYTGHRNTRTMVKCLINCIPS
jgi:hypothetical protein